MIQKIIKCHNNSIYPKKYRENTKILVLFIYVSLRNLIIHAFKSIYMVKYFNHLDR